MEGQKSPVRTGQTSARIQGEDEEEPRPERYVKKREHPGEPPAGELDGEEDKEIKAGGEEEGHDRARDEGQRFPGGRGKELRPEDELHDLDQGVSVP
jgi:hypothetical protein